VVSWLQLFTAKRPVARFAERSPWHPRPAETLGGRRSCVGDEPMSKDMIEGELLLLRSFVSQVSTSCRRQGCCLKACDIRAW